ncbi:histidine kinase [Bacillus sp. NP157]|nr:histidine kinase [Bacillus sp. NP157]
MKVRLGTTQMGMSRYLSLWGAVAVVFALQGYMRDDLGGRTWDMSDYLRWSIIQWFTWAALAPLVFRLGEHFPVRTPLRWRELWMPLLASVGMTGLALLIGALVSSVTEGSSLALQWRQFVGQHAATGMLTCWALFAIQQAMQYREEKARRELETSELASELAQSRLQVLRTQLQPHFLFNTMHAIATLLHEDVTSAEDMLLRLSDLLRAFLDECQGQEITLRQELVLLDLYLGIQRTRFKDRLDTRIYISPDTLSCAVPSLILQPIVENAIRHGIGERVGTDCVEIESRREGDILTIEVRNRNSVLEPGGSASEGHGIGLSNTRLRLSELYGSAGQVELQMLWPQGVACRLRMPFRLVEDDDADDAPEVAAA